MACNLRLLPPGSPASRHSMSCCGPGLQMLRRFSGSNFRLFDAISEAGGATVFASTEKTRIVRGDPTHPEFINADLQRLIENGDQSQNMLLASGDLVYVPRNGWGNVNILNERIRPLFELLLWPARTVIDWYNATDIVGSGRVR